MPLTKKGIEILSSMKKQYGAKKGEEVFYASAKKGTIVGVHGKSKGEKKVMAKHKMADAHMMSDKEMKDKMLNKKKKGK